VSEHTPGPWVAGPYDGSRVAIWAGEFRIAEAFTVPHCGREVIETNAAAMAAVPEFIQEIKDLISTLNYAAEDLEGNGLPRSAKSCHMRADHAQALLDRVLR
jgi:hypothetical protein